MTSVHQPQLPPPSSSAWDNQALYTALHSAGVLQQPPSASEWFLDTDATNHMTSSAGNIHSPRSFSSSIVVRNGARLPVTHAADTSFPTSSHPIELYNILVSPLLSHESCFSSSINS
jgi:hypothetical protein